jgi:hypothetical protein
MMSRHTSTPSRQLREAAADSRLRWLRMLFLITIGAALTLEAQSSAPDPLVSIGGLFHSNVSSWLDCSIKDCSLKFANVKVIFSVLEITLFVIFVLWLLLVRGGRGRQRAKFDRGTLFVPLLVFAGMLALGVLNGITKGGGDSTIALWEVRGFLMMFVMYFLGGIFLTAEDHINKLTWVVLISAGILATDNIIRWWFLYHNQAISDLGYDHIDSIVLVFAALLCVNLLLFGGTRAQVRYSVILLPVILVALEVMQRRAAFAILAVGMVVLVLVILRLRPRLFWTVVLPCLFVVLLYLGAFWNTPGSLGQPSRAISSMFTPDPRDAASNYYRLVEKLNIQANIATSPILGLGFGQQFSFYYPMPDLSFWPFWHYTPHNAVLWVWLKDGALGFAAFFWLLGRAVYDGSVALESQREHWQLVATIRRALARRRGRPVAAEKKRPADLPLGFDHLLRTRGERPGRRHGRSAGAQSEFAWNIPSWERREGKTSNTAPPRGAVALFATAICLVPMQIAFSYVDLGLTSERDLLLLGLMLGILARAQVQLRRDLGAEGRAVRKRGRPVVAPTFAADEPSAEPAGTVPSQPGTTLD